MKILVSDFDGTITRNDFYALVAERHMRNPGTDYFAGYRAGRLTHFDAMASYFAHTPTDEASLAGLLRDTEPDPELGAAAARLRAAGWELVIVSAGSSWYIERILAACGVEATVYSNPGRIEAGRGLVLERDRGARFYSEEAGVDKAAVVRDALARAEEVAFAGDGPPDVIPALLVRPAVRFARGYLAEELRRRGEGFREYGRWSEVVDGLTGGAR
ncbi:MAG TPA: 2,3-diketo-5-methylthio-1-phosphopentane phosphatase [Solibacterales bacterium]|nr:2,3-diketo-5-methylthio-1-phosphopentane phosphatase [Bryobacterales bacterium]